MREYAVGNWRFSQASDNLIHAWAPGALHNEPPDAVVPVPRSLVGMGDEQFQAHCANWLENMGVAPGTRVQLRFQGTRMEFLAWLHTWDPMRDNPALDTAVARHPAGKGLGAWSQ